jgi:16S rRNA (adenine1518-N6/adenine1519-N6)-dimethyltransferase
MRRKTLNNNFKTLLTTEDWEQLTISPTLRAQDLSISEFVKLTQFYSSHKKPSHSL